MNKKDLIEFIFDKLNKKVARKIVGDVVNGFMDGILHSVSKGEAIKLVGFMNINLKNYDERMARNPKTGLLVKIPASVKASAKLGTLFKAVTKKIKPAAKASATKKAK